MTKPRTSWNSTLRPRSAKKEAAMKGEKPKPRSTFKKPTLEELKAQGKVVTASTLAPKSGSVHAIAIDRADTAFSKAVRWEAADKSSGDLHCFICGKRVYWKDAELMHFQPRTCMPTRYHEQACQAGCSECNGKPLGDRKSFAKKLDLKYGPGTAEALTILSKQMKHWSVKELLLIVDECEGKMQRR